MAQQRPEHYAAGILPVTWHEGELLFLVGQDVRDRSWSDFGGKCERVDRGDPLATACREFYEETYGCVADHRALRSRLCAANCIALRSRTQNDHPYWMFVAQMPYQPHLRNAFQKALAFLRHRTAPGGGGPGQKWKSFVEKIDVQWVSWDTLRTGAGLPRRPVFQATLQAHEATLARLAAGEPWDRLCAECT
jgi:8-oxo-dGTP pyrophosphatase MutT (NUDIX family)